MSDRRVRELERRWRETGAEEDQGAWISERVRLGLIDSLDVIGASYLGHRVAKQLRPIHDVCTMQHCGRKIAEHPIAPSEFRPHHEVRLTCPGYPLREASSDCWWKGLMDYVGAETATRAMTVVAEAVRTQVTKAGTILLEDVELQRSKVLVAQRAQIESLALHGVGGWTRLPVQTVLSFVIRERIQDHGADSTPGYFAVPRVVDAEFPIPPGFDEAVERITLVGVRSAVRQWANRELLH